jgi:23S rRNA (uridine2552-2'-O)-methyltransferase
MVSRSRKSESGSVGKGSRAQAGKGGGKGGKGGGKSSGWYERHVGDVHVRRAQEEGYRSRASYKLAEIDQRDHLVHKGARVLELGAAPGGWTQYVVERIGPEGVVVASDLLDMDAVAGVEFVQGDFTEQETADRIEQALGDGGADVVLSDMAPNLTGVASTDQARSMALAELALDMARSVLKPGGGFVVKVFQGEGFDSFVRKLRSHFRQVKVRKPEASRSRSREVYLVATDHR